MGGLTPLTSDADPGVGKTPTRRFEALDGWRGICALSVVLFHLNAETHLYALTRHAYVAVDFFFVLSGFVLMSATGERLGERAAFHRFVLRRIARLLPLHFAAITALLTLFATAAWREGGPVFAGSHSLGGLIQCLLLVQGFTTDALSWNFPSWSISLELWASVLFGVILWRAGRRAWMVLGAAGLVLTAAVLAFGEPAGPAVNEVGALLKACHYLMAFFVGAVLHRVSVEAARRGWTVPAWTEWVTLALVIGIFLFADRMASPLSVALFAVVILVFAHESGPISAWLRGTSPQALGRWSYSIYLIHPFWTLATFKLLSATGAWLGHPATASDSAGTRLVLGGPFAMDAVAIACVGAVVATAAITYRLVERPGMRLANSRLVSARRVALARVA